MVYRAGLSSIPLLDDEPDAKPSPSNIVAFLLSESPFTKATLLRALKSPVPLMLLHVPPLDMPPEDESSAVDQAESPTSVDCSISDDFSLAGVIWNPAMQTLLPDSELKVEVGAGESRRFGIWQGSTRL